MSHTWGDHIHANTVWCPLQRERLGEHGQSRFAGAVSTRAGMWYLTRHRRGETSRTATTLQMRVACFGKKPRSPEVDGEHAVPVLDRQVADLRRARDSSICYQAIQATKFGYRSFDKSTWHVGIAEVTDQRDGRTSH